MSKSPNRSAPGEVAGYKLLARLKSSVDTEVYIAEARLPPIKGRRVLLERAPRDREDYAELEAMLFQEGRSQPTAMHPNVSGIIDYFDTDEGAYLVLEYVLGSDLFALGQLLTARAHALNVDLAAYIIAELLKGLHHIHTAPRGDGGGAGMVIKRLVPERVLLGNDGTVKFATAPLTRIYAQPQHLENGPERYGYYAVEWVAGEALSPVSNVYTAGVMLFELLIGRPCFVGKTVEDVLYQVTTRGVRVKELITNGVPGPLAAVVERATRIAPEQRFSSAGEMARTITDLLAEREEKDLRGMLAQFLATHRLAARSPVFGDVVTARAEKQGRKNSHAREEDELFGLRKPSRRTVTKVGLRTRAKSTR